MKIAFLGAGRMSGAMVTGLLARKVFTAGEIACTGAADGTAEALASRTGIRATYDLEELLADASVVAAAFKPQQLAEVDPHLAALAEGKLLLSILAGSRIAVLAEKFPRTRNIVRVMPNSPGQIGAGISAYSFQSPPSAEDRKLVEAILGSLGEHVELPESQLDAVTGLSGSGPAYVFEFIAALRDGGVAAGLAPEVAHKLALATVAGAAKLVQETGTDPEVLREQVASPGGTTLAGLKRMEEGAFRHTLRETILAATRRSEELSGSA
jgi:pyrroline-5-carboxylate reductase